MTHRMLVAAGCATRCPSCVACHPATRDATLPEVLAHADLPELILGGGDATRWAPLATLLDANARRPTPQRLWVEAPAASLTRPVLAGLARRGAHGVLVQIEAMGEAMARALRVGDGEAVVRDAEALGLATQARVCVRPRTFPIVAPLARRLAPRPVWLELVRQDWGAEPVPMWPAPIARAMQLSPNVNFSAHRMLDRAYLPPCLLPSLWASRPTAWRTTLAPREAPNAALAACGGCSLNKLCHWRDPDALTPEVAASARPVADPALPWERPRATEAPVPAAIVRQRTKPDVVCVTPWTTMEVVDPDGRVRQCCSTWTIGDRGNVIGASLEAVWNGPGYRAARRAMAGRALDALCNPVCSRLHDEKFAERELRIQEGSEAFVRNQLVMAEEIAQRRDEVRARPLYLALCPSTYCNYDCIMCDLGRTPRRELPEALWDELPAFLPTLRTLTLLGGEPLANPLAMRFLREFDASRWPDAAVDLVTNGALLTEKALRHMTRCTLGNVTLSLNAGTGDVYERVQRGVPLADVLANLDALLRFRAAHHRWFGVTLSFVVQPAASATLVAFGELAHARDVPIRLMALNPENHEGLDFYTDPDAVARVVRDVDAFLAWAERVRPEWLGEIRAARSAVVAEARARVAPGAPPGAGRRVLPVVS